MGDGEGMIPPPPLPQEPLPETEPHEPSVEPYVPEPISHPSVRRRLFPAKGEEELPEPPVQRHRTHDRAQRAPLEEVNNRRNIEAEAEMQRDEELHKISEQVDRISRRMEELRQPIEMGVGAPLEMENAVIRTGSPFIPEILAESLGHKVKIPDLP